MPCLTSQVRFSPRPSFSSRSTSLRLCSAWRKPSACSVLSSSSPTWPKGVWPMSCPERNRLGKVLVEIQGPRDGPGDLGNLQGVSEPGDIMVAARRDEYLGLVLQPAKRLGVDEPIAVPLEFASEGIGLLGRLAPSAVERRGRVGGQGRFALLDAESGSCCRDGSRVHGRGDQFASWPDCSIRLSSDDRCCVCSPGQLSCISPAFVDTNPQPR